MTRTAAVIAALTTAVTLWAVWYISQPTPGQFAACSRASVAGDASIGGPFTLVNGAGETVTDQDVITEPTLIYFGYTFCPDVCPLDTVRNAEVIDLLAERGISATPVFISIDPERDTPQVVADFAESLHEKMIGLTGSPEQIEAVSKAYKTYYKRQPSEDEFYFVDHSSFSYLTLPDHGFVEFFRRDLNAEQVAQTVQCFVENA